MKSRNSLRALLVGSLLAIQAAGPAHAVKNHADVHFDVAQRFSLSGTDRWDYLGLDVTRHRLFVSRASHVQVVDTHTGAQIGEIANTDGVHGFALAQDRGVGFITNGHANTVSVFNLDSLSTVDTVKVGGQDPDAIAYSTALKRIFTSNGDSSTVSAIDVDSRKLVATTDVGGKPESLVTDDDGIVFVNIEDKDAIVEIDGKTNTVLAHWSLAGCKDPSGLAIDTHAHRLFSVCSNQRMAVVDSRSGHVVSTLPIGRHPDAAAFDPKLNAVFSSNGGDGTLTVVHEDGADHYHVVQTLPTQAGARTLALDSNAHELYLVTGKLGPVPATTRQNAHPRAQVISGTFNVMVVRPRP
ncbi:YncE family protein [Caballeronia sordidicola]|uniref:Ig-like repeat domain protein 3 n=1 Tax=Caballeronia sordidicola TaxID=196367 RepID=A0A242M3F8_CABSO|nr:YncE family protein [Caballeronia sordidicola]OTP65725.1 Ig-like repeat domain protein 3 [Caballeronia sordidicola]